MFTTSLLLCLLTCLGKAVLGSYIIHGQKAPEHTMQYMVSLQNAGGHVCGGFLITQNFVLTAAHCDDFHLMRVVMETNNIKGKNYLVRGIEASYKPDNYESPGKGEDIMLLKLAVEVDIDDRIHTIALPRPNTNLVVNQVCSIAGWGKTKTDGPLVDELRAVNVSLLDVEYCRKQWRALPSHVMCAGGSNTDRGFCQGDSGGPLVCDGVAVGIASFNKHLNCDYPDVPNVYTDISGYIDWINEKMNTSYYDKYNSF